MITASGDFTATRQIVEILQNFSSQDQGRILRWTAEKLGLAAAEPDTIMAPSGIAAFKHILIKHKESNDRLFAATVAYAHKFHAPPGFSRKFITSDDLGTAARQIGRSAPHYPSQTLINAAQAGLLRKIMHGKYALTAQGQRAVEAADDGRVATAAKPRILRCPKRQR